jgi:hypothetical protein
VLTFIGKRSVPGVKKARAVERRKWRGLKQKVSEERRGLI